MQGKECEACPETLPDDSLVECRECKMIYHGDMPSCPSCGGEDYFVVVQGGYDR